MPKLTPEMLTLIKSLLLLLAGAVIEWLIGVLSAIGDAPAL